MRKITAIFLFLALTASAQVHVQTNVPYALQEAPVTSNIVVVKWTNGVPIDVAKVVEAPPMPLETIGKGPGVWMGTSQVVTNQTKRVLPPAASGVCFKCGSGTNVVPMKVFKLEKDVGVPMLGGVNRISQGVLKCPKCGIRVAFTNQVWIPEEKMKAITK